MQNLYIVVKTVTV